jgi:hypothetical protein
MKGADSVIQIFKIKYQRFVISQTELARYQLIKNHN